MEIFRLIGNWLLSFFSLRKKRNFSKGTEIHNMPSVSREDPLARPDLFELKGDIVTPREDADLEELTKWRKINQPSGAITGSVGSFRDILCQKK